MTHRFLAVGLVQPLGHREGPRTAVVQVLPIKSSGHPSHLDQFSISIDGVLPCDFLVCIFLSDRDRGQPDRRASCGRGVEEHTQRAAMSGLVGTLRAINADDPVELHDLGGYDAAQVAELVQGAFAQPLPARAPVKVCISSLVLF